jgi:hypothetical protein
MGKSRRGGSRLTPDPGLARPEHRERSVATVADGSTYIYLDGGAPPGGEVWRVTRVAIYGAEPFVTPPAGAQVMICKMLSVPGNTSTAPAGFPGVVASPAPFPNAAHFSAGEFELGLDDHVVIVIKNLPQGYAVLGTVEIEARAERRGQVQTPRRAKQLEALARLKVVA